MGSVGADRSRSSGGDGGDEIDTGTVVDAGWPPCDPTDNSKGGISSPVDGGGVSRSEKRLTRSARSSD